MLTVLGGLAEFERDLIRARTAEGRERQAQSLDGRFDPGPASLRRVGHRPPAFILQDALHGKANQRPPVSGDQCGCRLLFEQLVHAGQRAEGIHAQPPIGNGGRARMNRATGA